MEFSWCLGKANNNGVDGTGNDAHKDTRKHVSDEETKAVVKTEMTKTALETVQPFQHIHICDNVQKGD